MSDREILKEFVFDPDWQNILEIMKGNINAKILWVSDGSGEIIESLDENYHDLCKLIRKSPKGLKKCQNSHYTRFHNAKKADSPILTECYCGLMGFAIPISFNKEFIGALGGYIPNSDFPLTIEKCAEISLNSNIDIKDIMGYAKEIKHISKADQRKLLEQFNIFANMLQPLIKWVNKAGLTDKIEYQHNNYMACLGEVYDILKSKDNGLYMLNSVVYKIKHTMSVDACSIYLMDNANEIVLSFTSGLPDSAIGQHIKVGEGIIGYSAEKLIPLAIEDATLDPRSFRIVTGTSSRLRTYRAILSMPLISDNMLLGVIDIRKFNKNTWEQKEINFLSLIAKYIADYIKPINP